MSELKFRHEIKHQINIADCYILKSRLRAVARSDPYAKNGVYHIRSLYFDNIYDKALFEKIDGTAKREKFRIRYYDGDLSCIRLEKKSKIGKLCNKQSVLIDKDEVSRLLNKDYDFMKESIDERPLLAEFYTKIMGQGLMPKTIVDYTREPFVYDPGNVRVTIDSNIRTGIDAGDFLNWDCVTIPVPEDPIILEVKWDEYLPDIIKDAVQLSRSAGAFSKYAACRAYM